MGSEHFAPAHLFRSMTALGVCRCWAAAGLLAVAGQNACADLAFADTYLTDLRVGGRFSAVVQQMARGGFELSDGTYVDFARWYTPYRKEVSVEFLSMLAPEFGILWGFGTGERGRKYTIHPSFTLGLLYQREIIRNGWVTFRVDGVFGGDLVERSCMADFGAIGGRQKVHCRFAAEPIAPRKTLRFLERRRGFHESRVWLGFAFRF